MGKKTSAIAITAAAVSLTLTIGGCTGSGGQSTNNGDNASTAPSKTTSNSPSEDKPKVMAPYQLSVVYPGTSQKDEVMIEDEINKYLKDKIPNTTVDLMPISWDAYTDKTNLFITTQEKIDLLFAPSWLGFFNNVSKGAYQPLDDLLEKYGQGIKQSLNPLYLLAPRYKGKLYAIPTNKEIAQGEGYLFRKDIVEKDHLDLSAVKGVKDLAPLLQTIKEKEPDFIPLFQSVSTNVTHAINTEFGNQFENIDPGPDSFTFIDVKKGDFKVLPVTDPSYLKQQTEMYNTITDYWNKGYINKDAGITKATHEELARQGKVWFIPHATKPGLAAEYQMDSQSGKGPDKIQWDQVDISAPYVTTDGAAGSQFVIPNGSKAPDRAMIFLNLLYTDKYLINLVNYGIEGKHYTKTNENRIEKVKDSGFDPGMNWMIGNQMLNYLLPGEADDKYEVYKQFNDSAVQSPILGFSFDVGPVQNELAALKVINDKYTPLLNTGTPDSIKMLTERNQKYVSAGIDKVVAEAQKQLDQWLADNGKK